MGAGPLRRSSPGSPPPDASLRPVAHCMLCGSPRRSLRFREDPFAVVRCEDCGLVYVTPQVAPEALPTLYDESYWRSDCPSQRGYGDYLADESLYLRTFQRRLRFLRRHLPPSGRALDVGCAAGFFLQVLRDNGWEACGVEPSPAVARHAREVAGFEVHESLDAPSLASGPGFDLVTFWDVIEHLPDPAAALRRARALLRDDGVLVLETQNVESRFARLLGRRWQHYKHLEHLYHFSPHTLEALLRKTGFALQRCTARHAGKHVSVAFVRERATRLHPGLRRWLAPLAPLDRLGLYVNPGDEMIAVARKRSP